LSMLARMHTVGKQKTRRSSSYGGQKHSGVYGPNAPYRTF
jgi:hypothetical protein